MPIGRYITYLYLCLFIGIDITWELIKLAHVETVQRQPIDLDGFVKFRYN